MKSLASYLDAVKAVLDSKGATAFMASCQLGNYPRYVLAEDITDYTTLVAMPLVTAVVLNYFGGSWLIAPPTRPEEVEEPEMPNLRTIAYGLAEAEWLHSQGYVNTQNFDTLKAAQQHCMTHANAVAGPALSTSGALIGDECGIWERLPTWLASLLQPGAEEVFTMIKFKIIGDFETSARAAIKASLAASGTAPNCIIVNPGTTEMTSIAVGLGPDQVVTEIPVKPQPGMFIQADEFGLDVSHGTLE